MQYGLDCKRDKIQYSKQVAFFKSGKIPSVSEAIAEYELEVRKLEKRLEVIEKVYAEVFNGVIELVIEDERVFRKELYKKGANNPDPSLQIMFDIPLDDLLETLTCDKMDFDDVVGKFADVFASNRICRIEDFEQVLVDDGLSFDKDSMERTWIDIFIGYTRDCLSNFLLSNYFIDDFVLEVEDKLLPTFLPILAERIARKGR
jgi:hypothetical protein